MFDNPAECSLLELQILEKMETFSGRLLFPQLVHLEMKSAQLTTLLVLFAKVPKKFRLKRGNDYKI